MPGRAGRGRRKVGLHLEGRARFLQSRETSEVLTFGSGLYPGLLENVDTVRRRQAGGLAEAPDGALFVGNGAVDGTIVLPNYQLPNERVLGGLSDAPLLPGAMGATSAAAKMDVLAGAAMMNQPITSTPAN